MSKTLAPKLWVPHQYQSNATHWTMTNPRCALFLDPGMGKTAITLETIRHWKETNRIKKTLIVAPLRVCYEVWPNEIKKWSNFSGLTYAVLHGKDKILELYKDVDIYIINYEGLDWLSKTLNGNFSMFDYLVIDELSKFKSHSSKRFKCFKNCGIKYRLGLTGSPAANSMLGLFGQIFMLDEGKAFGKYFTHFRARYFRPTGFNLFNWVLNEGAEELIHEKLSHIAYRLRTDGNVEMPEKKVTALPCKLSAAAMATYKEIEQDFITQLKDITVVAATAAAASNKCRQAANGAVYYTENESGESVTKVVELHDAKLDVLEELVEELQGAPLLCAYSFRHDVDRIKKRFPNAPVVRGDTPPAELSRVLAAWDRGDIPLLLGHPAAMGHGLNLQAKCNHIAWFGPTWDYELYDQFNRRVWRQGNPFSVVHIYHIVAVGTKDANILNVLANKALQQDKLLDALTIQVDVEDINLGGL